MIWVYNLFLDVECNSIHCILKLLASGHNSCNPLGAFNEAADTTTNKVVQFNIYIELVFSAKPSKKFISNANDVNCCYGYNDKQIW